MRSHKVLGGPNGMQLLLCLDILIPSRRALRISFQLADADVPDQRRLDMDADLSEATP